jgi:MYXO-CTERM domain-containing protein
MLRRIVALTLPIVCLWAGGAHAQSQVQVKPWFLVIVDTSGSMQTNCTNGASNPPACTTCAGGCTTTANSCGWAHTRVNDAKCALRNILNSTGDAEFALMQFSHPCRTLCDSQGGASSGTCDATLSVALSQSNYSLLTWVDGVCQGSCTNGAVTQEIYAYGNTPIGQSLVRAKEYFTGAMSGFSSPTATDAYAGCRPVATIILTDGDETCGGSPTTAATSLRTSSVPSPNGGLTIDIKTYAIGFGLTAPYANIENIAIAGGTDAPGAYKGFYAQNEEDISSALNLIITNSQLVERCDGKDNDCDTRIDEDNPKFCDVRGIRTSNPLVPNPANPSTTIDQSLVDSRVPACSGGTCPAVAGVEGNAVCAAPEYTQSSTCSPANILCSSPGELCDGRDDDCDGKVDENAPPIAASNEVCGDFRDNDCDGSIDENCNGCIPQPEVCNNLSDDCDSNIDEGLTRACGSNVGVCMAGTETCTAGVWGGCTAVTGTTETCNNQDDDCDGVVDGITMTCGVSNVGLCRLGVRTCTAGSFGACVGNVDPAPELCDGLDNNCDGSLSDDGSADSRVGQACGSGLGVCMRGTTVCAQGEIKCVGATTGTTELCDGIDNDCDGNIDEGVAGTDIRVGQPCIAPNGQLMFGPVMTQGQCRLGAIVCSAGMLVCPGYVGPTPELCDNLDQDCDGDPINGVASTDPRVGAACGTSIGECDPGQILCIAGALSCSAAPGSAEVCNGKDDDCDGLTDENLPAMPTACNTGGHSNLGVCKDGLLACFGGGIVCAGEVTPSPEICDGLDNDCNGIVDDGNPGGGRICGSSIGECHTGMTTCTAGMELCVGATQPTVELCDGKDNNCNGLTDEGNPEGGASCDTDADGNVLIGSCRTSVDPTNTALPLDQPCGECRAGKLVCGAGKLSCVGTIGIKPEVCDGLDNDCDSPCVLDNSNPQNPVRKCPVDPCQLPKSDPHYLDCDAKVDEDVATSDPNVGVVCVGGSGECKQGTEQCVGGVLSCVGGQIPVVESCNGKDDDCDTLIDEGFDVGSPCGSSVGECGQGTLVCDPQTGGMKCQNEKLPTPERCDGLDNDCNGVVDDGNPGGGAVCGSSVGECRTGVEQCIAGKLQCAGAKAASLEVCDCLDNDCDGTIDEDPSPGSAVCPGSSVCTMCQCAQPCRDMGEFLVGCPSGKTNVTVDNKCVCVGERCNETTCGAETLKAGDSVLCTPGSKQIGSCVCKNNTCVARCDGVVCSSGLICDPTDGLCKERSCLLSQFACASGQFCDIATLSCAADPCSSTVCDAGQACRDGQCLGSCAGVTCSDSQSCHDGSCVDNRCHNVACQNQQTCDPSSGQCVAAGVCVTTGCKAGYVCNQVSGACDPDACLRTTCPAHQVCANGECQPRCSLPLVECNETCVNPSSSRDHCGASGDCQNANAGKACTGTQVCSEGSCTDTCKAGLLNCEGGCVDPDNDRLHCGASGMCQGSQAGVACPSGTLCKGGSCLTQTSGGKTPATSREPERRVSTDGGGGCACSVPSAQRSQRLPRGMGLLLLLGLFARRRWRSRVWQGVARSAGSVSLLIAAGVLGSLLLGGCRVNTLCLNCTDSDAGKLVAPGGFNNPDASVTMHSDSGVLVTPDAGGSSVQPDASVHPDAGSNCVDTELCNGLDDDCDGKIDEGVDPVALGIDTKTDALNCGVCGNKCNLAHAFSKCVAGQCKIDMCDAEYTDLDAKDATGCEYRCTKVADDDKICDRRDDDCDQKIDENVDFKTDRANCGSCGNVCEPPNAKDAGYCDQGTCKLDPSKCNAGFVDTDGLYANGCEYQCTVVGAEQCNGSDDDCDRKVDEDVVTSDTRIGVACGLVSGVCQAGVQGCAAGAVVCQGGQGPTTEVCNGKDDDCDGNTDESFPQRGLPCGNDLGECVRGNQQCVAGALVCLGGSGPVPELCDGKDNDCDGKTDESNQTDGPPVGVGQACKTTGGTLSLNPPAVVGECRLGIAQCLSGQLACIGEVGPQPELCDAKDQDCDGDPLNGVTTTDPLIGAACGTDVGECKFGRYICSGGQRVCDNSGGKVPQPEVCNGKDDDCDGSYDETDAVTHVKPVGAGNPCRVDSAGVVHSESGVSVQGECKLGTTICSGGVVACPDFVGPTPELCDNLDQDCDGDPINGVQSTDPRVGQNCASGSNVGVCRTGTQYCNAGVIACQGTVQASAELCDGLDNNCNGSVTDDGADEPTLNSVCGVNIGACRAGAVRCIGGALQCFGQTSASAELCDSVDNDCDGLVDEDFQLQTNVNRCGSCSNVCAFANATPRCVSGACQIASCLPGYHDSASTPGPDCNVGPCTVAGSEICNGVDDDCNGLVDDGLTTPPSGVCSQIGVCATGVATCQHASGWVCSKVPSTELCNGLDDNCNGQIDEGFPVGQACSAAGTGACATPGTLRCNPAGTSTFCANSGGSAVTTGSPTQETCNGLDDDCDGTIDEPCPSSDNNCVTDAWVSLGSGTDIYQYEASRPDATNLTAGAKNTRACSAANRLPWANLTYLEARAACDAADPNGRLCTEAEWEQACMDDPGGSCSWGFPDFPGCNSWLPDTCNGVDYTSTPDIQASGHSGVNSQCYRGPSATPAQQIFELTGNVKEYVLQRNTGAIPVRGGATNNTQDGLRCDFDFPVWPNNSAFSNVGFRCCRSATPLPTQCATFQNTGLNVTDAVLATNSLDVGFAGVITDLNVVNFKGTHNTMSQVDWIELVGPDATVVRLLNQGYCGTNDNWSYVFDQEGGAALPVSNTSPCGNGNTYKAYASLTAFNGKNPYGTWTIRVHDATSSGSTSSPHINSWGLQVCINPN